MLRDQVFVLDHMYMSLFSTCGWILRLGVTHGVAHVDSPGAGSAGGIRAADGAHLDLAAGQSSARAEERGASANRLARHLFTIATTAPPGKEVRVTRIGDRLVKQRREAWERWYGPVAARVGRVRLWHTLAWAIFGAGYVGAVVFVSSGLGRDAGPGAAGARGGRAAIGLYRRDRGRDRIPARILARWFAAPGVAGRLCRGSWWSMPTHRRRSGWSDGIRFEHVSFAYPGTSAACSTMSTWS